MFVVRVSEGKFRKEGTGVDTGVIVNFFRVSKSVSDISFFFRTFFYFVFFCFRVFC